MNLGKHEMVTSSLDAFEALRSSLAYLRSVSIIFDGPVGSLGTITKELKAVLAKGQSTQDLRQMSLHCSKAAICTHVALLYTAICFYLRLLEINPALRHHELDRELRTVTDSGLFESMREVRNALFHIRPNTQSERLLAEVVRRTLANKLAFAKLERLLYDATETVFRSPEDLFQEREEVLMQGFQDALDYYKRNLSDASSDDHVPS